MPALAKRLHSLAEAAAFLGVLATAASFLGRYFWFCEIFTHFKPQLGACFLVYAALEWLARHRHHALASLFLAAVNILPLAALFLPAQTEASVPTPRARLRILQANILTSNTNAPALLALVARENPDVVVLQEPDPRWLRQLESLTNDYPVFAAMPREDNFGAAIYCRTNARAARIFLLSDPEGAPSTIAHIGVDDKTVTVVGTHTLAPCNAYLWHGRNAFTRELAETLHRIRGPLVVTGDFNNTPWSTFFRDFIAVSGLIDSEQGRGPQPSWPTFSPPWARIPLDHCFHTADVRILDKRRGPDIGSDHLPLIIDIAF